MLSEIKDVRQIPKDGFRRWFTDNFFDLIVWYDNDRLEGFQLCYDKGNKERALTWRTACGYAHNRIDDGERPFANKMTPILVADGAFQKDLIAESFKAAAVRIDEEIASLVYDKLKGCPDLT